jgi:ketopantoate reductase
MSGLKNFTVAGLGIVGSYIARELLQLKNEGKVDNVTILTRSVSCHTWPLLNAFVYLSL